MKTLVFVAGAAIASTGAAILFWHGLSKNTAVASIRSRGPEVYAVFKEDGSGWPADQVNRIASEYGGRVATIEQLAEAREFGAKWCVPAWVTDTVGNGYVADWPISGQSVPVECTNVGGPNALNYKVVAGVAVYGVKPSRAKNGHKIVPV